MTFGGEIMTQLGAWNGMHQTSTLIILVLSPILLSLVLLWRVSSHKEVFSLKIPDRLPSSPRDF